MLCYVDNKKIRLNPYNMKYSKEISTVKGTTSDVYLINDKAYKLYRLPFLSEPINKKTIQVMKTIKTKRIILPENAILNKKRIIIGTISPYIADLGRDNLLSLSKRQFISEIKFLQEDCISLGEESIGVRDLILSNFVFNNGIYFIDVGKFNILDNDPNIVISENIERFNTFFIHSFLIPMINKYSKNKSKTSSKIMDDFYRDLRRQVSIPQILEEDFQEETFEKYLIKKARLK